MGRRIIVSPTPSGKAVAPGAAANPPSGLSDYADRLKNLIPAEVSAIYLAGQGIIPSGQTTGLSIWAIFCFIGTVFFMAQESKTGQNNPGTTYPVDWTHVFISSISFIVWVYTLGVLATAFGIYVSWVGTLMMLGWTFIVPLVYKGTNTSPVPVKS